MGKSAVLLISLLVLAGCSQPVSAPTSKPLPSPTLEAGDVCQTRGQVANGITGPLVCRWISNETGRWMELTGSDEFPGQLAIDQLPVEECKIRDQRPVGRRGGGSTAFPRSEERIPASGVVNVAIVPIDYPDAPGTGAPIEWIQEHLNKIDEWTQFFTDGRLKYNWVISDQWIRMPKDAKWYVWDHPRIVNGKYILGEKQLQSDYDQAYQVFTEADKYFELEKIDFAWVFSYPGASEVDWAPAYAMNQKVPTANGTYPLSYYSIGTFLYAKNPNTDHNRPLWITMLHEMGHAHGLAGHAPGNGWAYDVMSSGSTLSAWNGWLVDWIPDEEFVCIDGTKPATHQVVLDSVDLNRGGTIALVIRLSSSEVIVVESRRKGPFSIDFPEGLAAITGTYVNSKRIFQRFDSNFEKEMDYFSYFIRAEGTKRSFVPAGPDLGNRNVLGYPGDTLVHENIRIRIIESNEFDTIEIEVLTN